MFELAYDKNDRRKEQKQLLPMDEDNYGKMEFGYDVRGNVLACYRNDILLEQNTYDIRGNRLSHRDGDGIKVSFRYGLQNEQLEAFTAGSRKQERPARKLTFDALLLAQGDRDIFLKLFDNLKNNVKSNPDMLYKEYWK